MIRVFICPACGTLRVVSKYLEAECYTCGTAMKCCSVPYVDWVELDSEKREAIRRQYMESRG